MQLSVMQPTYLPWMGYFDLIAQADKFVFLDDVKLEKCSWQVRNRIKGANGEIMLTCPVSTPKGRMEAKISETYFASTNPWRKKHLKAIHSNYRKAPFFDYVYAFLEPFYLDEAIQNLSQFNTKLIVGICNQLTINTPIYYASQLPLENTFKDKKLVRLCQLLDCDEYYSPMGAKAYIEANTPGGELVKNGISVFYQNFNHPKYPQLFGDFMSHLCVLDVLFNVGFDESAELIKIAHQQKIRFDKL